MCGILGVLGQKSKIPKKQFNAALDTLSHRGPDASSTWEGKNAQLGHRRLAIIDLSENGTQPFVDPQSGLLIVYNGEIYNYLELRKTLEELGHTFRTETDTEVLLKGYLEWGDGVLERCNGMWAFVIWDPKEQRAFFSRDRFGVKPFYYAREDGSFLFASEPKALHAINPALTEVNPNAVAELIVNTRLHVGTQSPYKHVEALPAGHCGYYHAIEHKLTTRRYWDYPESPTGKPEITDYDEFCDLFDDAVRIRLRSDVEVGLTLSGGLDSSAVLSASRKMGAGKLKCFTSVYAGASGGELSWAQKAAELAGTQLTPVASNLETWWSTLENVVHHLDGPGFSPAVLPLWSIMKQSRADNVPVLLEGQGADELLAGYHWHSAINVLTDLKRLKPGRLSRNLPAMIAAHGLKSSAAWLTRLTFSDLYDSLVKSRRHKLLHREHIDTWLSQGQIEGVPSEKATYAPLKRRLLRDHSSDLLPSLLQYGDAISMAHGIESRLPFMDYRLVEWVFRNPVDLMKNGQTKGPVRAYLNRNQFREIAERKDKIGYDTPLDHWFRDFCYPQIQEMLTSPNEPIWDYLSKPEIQKMGERFNSDLQKSDEQLYKVVTLNLWLKQLNSRASGF